MRFSLFFEMQLSEPTPEREAELFRHCLALAVLADAIGYHGVWAVEHHGLREYSHSSAPEIFLSFVAAQTRRMRIGHAVTLLPSRYNHPIRIAERIATLDILSGGRIDWGTGKSSTLVEQKAFETVADRLDDEWYEAISIIPKMWREEVFSFRGRFFNIPKIQVIPKPLQKPHPPIFVACSKPESAERVGKLGLGALNFGLGTDDYLASNVLAYRSAFATSKPELWKANNHFACTAAALVLEDDRTACNYGLRGARFFSESFAQYYLSGTRPTGNLDISRGFPIEEELQKAMRFRNAPGSYVTTIMGDYLCARESVQRFVDAGVDEIMLIMQLGTVPNDMVEKSVRVFGEKVLPYFMEN
jgi:alkanesulfonate monooxygenase SsuD/methylene tetrahydromethanopterin reductase-like flavin-dependent oxidoreductase (luciferase family)